jgi:hypothetical protein
MYVINFIYILVHSGIKGRIVSWQMHVSWRYQVIKFYSRHHDLINRYVLSVSQITMNINTNHWHKYTTSVPSLLKLSFHNFYEYIMHCLSSNDMAIQIWYIYLQWMTWPSERDTLILQSITFVRCSCLIDNPPFACRHVIGKQIHISFQYRLSLSHR